MRFGNASMSGRRRYVGPRGTGLSFRDKLHKRLCKSNRPETARSRRRPKIRTCSVGSRLGRPASWIPEQPFRETRVRGTRRLATGAEKNGGEEHFAESRFRPYSPGEMEDPARLRRLAGFVSRRLGFLRLGLFEADRFAAGLRAECSPYAIGTLSAVLAGLRRGQVSCINRLADELN